MDENRRLRVRQEETCQGSNRSLLSYRNKIKCCHRVRKVPSKGAVLVIFWTFLVSASLVNINPTYAVPSSGNGGLWASVIVVVVISPVAGLVASIYVGRYRTLLAGLWLMWAGSVVVCAILTLQALWLIPETLTAYVLMAAAVVSGIGFALYLVNAVPFGLDQMPDASGEQICAFIHWYAWSFLTGLIAVQIVRSSLSTLHIHFSDVPLIVLLVPVLLLSVALCSNFVLHEWLTVEPKGKNPLRIFFGVLKFAARHKIPLRRSAFTYWEPDLPSRIDLAKRKYGGPFTNEEVEDTKTCLRMFLVIASISVTAVATMSACLLSIEVFHIAFDSWHRHSSPYTYILADSAGGLAVVLGFPVHEALIHPLTMKWIPSTLRRVGLSHILAITVSLLLLVTTTVWYMYSDTQLCMLTPSSSLPLRKPLPLDSDWIKAPYQILTFSLLFLYLTAMLEFVCAQAPYILRGLLVGLVYSIALSSYALGVGVNCPCMGSCL